RQLRLRLRGRGNAGAPVAKARRAICSRPPATTDLERPVPYGVVPVVPFRRSATSLPDHHLTRRCRRWPYLTSLGMVGGCWVFLFLLVALASEDPSPLPPRYYVSLSIGPLAVAAGAYIFARRSVAEPQRSALTAMAVSV